MLPSSSSSLQSDTTCSYCRKRFKDADAVTHHVAASKSCSKRHEKFLNSTLRHRQDTVTAEHPQIQYSYDILSEFDNHSNNADTWINDGRLLPGTGTRVNMAADRQSSVQQFSDCDALPPTTRHPSVTVEDVPDEDGYPLSYHVDIDEKYRAGGYKGVSRTTFDRIRDDQLLRNGEVWGPFKDEQEWELGKWLIKNVGRNQADEFLKLATVSLCLCSEKYSAS